jgi:hypothetical protein
MPNVTNSPHTSDSYTTACPKCGVDGKLTVVEAVLDSTGRKLKMNSPLSADGFEVPTRLKDASTDCEIVRCGACGNRFQLGEATL